MWSKHTEIISLLNFPIFTYFSLLCTLIDQVRPSDRLKSRQTTPTGDNDNSSALSEESDSVVKSKSPQAKKQSVRRGRPPESKNKKSSTPKKEAKAESPQKEFAVPKARKTPSKESPKKASSSTVVATNETGDDENDSSDEEFLPSSRGGRNRKRRGGHTGGRGRNARGGVAAGGRKNIQRTRKSPESPGSPEPTTRTTRASARNKRLALLNYVMNIIAHGVSEFNEVFDNYFRHQAKYSLIAHRVSVSKLKSCMIRLSNLISYVDDLVLFHQNNYVNLAAIRNSVRRIVELLNFPLLTMIVPIFSLTQINTLS